jgi:hypothetical protein
MTESKNKLIAPLLCGLLLFSSLSPAWAQQPVFVPGATPPPGSVPAQQDGVKAAPGLRILILEGHKRPNRLTEGVFAVPVVEVRDSNDRPIEGAQIVFTLPGGAKGAGASFRGGAVEKTFSTNAQGQASAEGYIPNSVEGKFAVRVKASYQGESTEIAIQQSNSFELQADADRKKSRAWRKWVWIGGAAAAAAIVAVILLGGSDEAASVITVTPGPPVIGGR